MSEEEIIYTDTLKPVNIFGDKVIITWRHTNAFVETISSFENHGKFISIHNPEI